MEVLVFMQLLLSKGLGLVKNESKDLCVNPV